MNKLVILLSFLFLLGCAEDPSSNPKHITAANYQCLDFEVVIVENCEYLRCANLFTHKGNCTNSIHAYNKGRNE